MIAFVYWVYDSSIVLALGAVVASLHEHRHVTAGSLPGDESPAVHNPSPVSDDETEPAPLPSPLP
jgi:membrane protein